MAYTFGGANGDDIVMPVVSAVIGPGVSGLMTCWANPSALTSGRAIFGFGNNLGRIAISATSGEVDLVGPTGATDGTWTSSGLALTTGVWRFLALAWSEVSGPTMDVKLWAGDSVTPPVAVTITQAVAPTGTFSTQTSATMGNGSVSAAIAFPGDLEQFDLFSTNVAVGANHPFAQSAYGAFSAESEALILDRYVTPLWLGTYRPRAVGAVVNNTTSMQHVSVDLGLLSAAYRHVQTSSANEHVASLTINGATFSQARGPRPRFGTARAGVGYRSPAPWRR